MGLSIGQILSISGCVTQEKFIAGRTLFEIEDILGFRPGRLSAGMAVVALLELPGLHHFNLAGYSQVALHRFKANPRALEGLNIEKLKSLAQATWTTDGGDRLVKVLPTIRHNPAEDPDEQYPPGDAAPQWDISENNKVRAKVVGIVSKYPDDRYVAADLVRR